MTYPFDDILRQTLSDLSARGFDQVHSTPKVIRFENKATGQELYIDRDGKPDRKKVSLVCEQREPKDFEGLMGAAKIGFKHSSNYTVLPKSRTRGGNMQHGGTRILLDAAPSYTAIIEEIERAA